jgi:hypothetical protein
VPSGRRRRCDSWWEDCRRGMRRDEEVEGEGEKEEEWQKN